MASVLVWALVLELVGVADSSGPSAVRLAEATAHTL